LLVNVEIKCLPWEPDADGADRPVVHAAAAAVRAHAPDAIVSSFDLDAVDACRAFAPELATAWLTSSQDVASASAIAAAHGHRWLHPDCRAALTEPERGIRAAHDLGLRVDVWTVDDPVEIRMLAAAGVDAIVTNVPDVALAALA
jgi:glycerophosphoryl diester phosphodiesterase